MTQESSSKNRRHRKDKPWDTDDIDHWKIEPFDAKDMPYPLLEESNFEIKFPKYREAYLKEVWPRITQILSTHGILCQLDLISGGILVKTTRKTVDPYMILRARDFVKLISRGVPCANAAKILEDNVACDVIQINNLCSDKERFIKRRQRLIGPTGNTLKAIELLTQCYVLIQGGTVSAIGSYKGLKEVRRIAIDCMKNVHPIYHIKELMIRRELAKDERLKGESWDRFLPHFKKIRQQVRTKLKVKKNKKKEYNPFPPPQQPRKEDLQIESGEYFLKPSEKKKRLEAEEKEKKRERKSIKALEKRKSYEPPQEILKL